MKFKSEVVTQASGSIGGVTYSHNRGGLYRRARSIPVSPDTPAQVAVRSAFGSLSSRWSQVLDDTQREGWKIYADNSPRTNTLGDPLILTGPQMYIRGNSLRVQAGLSIIDDAPGLFGLAELTIPEITGVTATTDTLVFTYDNTDDWANQDGGALLCWMSPPQSPAKTFYAGRYNFCGLVEGDSLTPPTSPGSIVSVFDYIVGQKVFVRLTAVDEIGRVSARFQGSVVAS